MPSGHFFTTTTALVLEKKTLTALLYLTDCLRKEDLVYRLVSYQLGQFDHAAGAILHRIEIQKVLFTLFSYHEQRASRAISGIPRPAQSLVDLR